MKNDRAETRNLAESHPDVINGMVAEWTEMAEQLLHAPKSAYAPVSTENEPHVHPEWTDFTREPAEGTGKKSKAGKKTGKAPPPSIRARKQTTMKILGDELHLQCSGTDSGIAIDRIAGNIPEGPYQLKFRVKSDAAGGSEVFFTVDRETKLPGGQHLTFEIAHDGGWHEQVIPLPTDQQVRAIRLDIGSQPGAVVIAGLRLTDRDGETVLKWPGED